MGDCGEEKLGVDTIIFHYMHTMKFSKITKNKNLKCKICIVLATKGSVLFSLQD